MMNKEHVFQEKARTYAVCFNDKCTLHAHCLRYKIAPYASASTQYLTCINPNYKEIADGKCDKFRNDEKVRMAQGMINSFDEMPSRTAFNIRNALIQKYSRKKFYAYRKGEQLIPPTIQQDIANTMQAYGWKQPPKFDKYVEDYCW